MQFETYFCVLKKRTRKTDYQRNNVFKRIKSNGNDLYM